MEEARIGDDQLERSNDALQISCDTLQFNEEDILKIEQNLYNRDNSLCDKFLGLDDSPPSCSECVSKDTSIAVQQVTQNLLRDLTSFVEPEAALTSDDLQTKDTLTTEFEIKATTLESSPTKVTTNNTVQSMDIFDKLHSSSWLKNQLANKKVKTTSEKSAPILMPLPSKDKIDETYIEGNQKKISKDKSERAAKQKKFVPLNYAELKSEDSKDHEAAGTWDKDKNSASALFPHAQGTVIDVNDDEKMKNDIAIAQSLDTYKKEEEQRKIVETLGGKVCDDDSGWGNDQLDWDHVRSNLPDDPAVLIAPSTSHGLSIDKFGRAVVNGCTEKHLYMGKGARNKEQEVIKSQNRELKSNKPANANESRERAIHGRSRKASYNNLSSQNQEISGSVVQKAAHENQNSMYPNQAQVNVGQDKDRYQNTNRFPRENSRAINKAQDTCKRQPPNDADKNRETFSKGQDSFRNQNHRNEGFNRSQDNCNRSYDNYVRNQNNFGLGSNNNLNQPGNQARSQDNFRRDRTAYGNQDQWNRSQNSSNKANDHQNRNQDYRYNNSQRSTNQTSDENWDDEVSVWDKKLQSDAQVQKDVKTKNISAQKQSLKNDGKAAVDKKKTDTCRQPPDAKKEKQNVNANLSKQNTHQQEFNTANQKLGMVASGGFKQENKKLPYTRESSKAEQISANKRLNTPENVPPKLNAPVRDKHDMDPSMLRPASTAGLPTNAQGGFSINDSQYCTFGSKVSPHNSPVGTDQMIYLNSALNPNARSYEATNDCSRCSSQDYAGGSCANVTDLMERVCELVVTPQDVASFSEIISTLSKQLATAQANLLALEVKLFKKNGIESARCTARAANTPILQSQFNAAAPQMQPLPAEYANVRYLQASFQSVASKTNAAQQEAYELVKSVTSDDTQSNEKIQGNNLDRSLSAQSVQMYQQQMYQHIGGGGTATNTLPRGTRIVAMNNPMPVNHQYYNQ